MNPELKSQFNQLKEEARAAIELEITLANFLAAGLADEVIIRRRAYEAAMAEGIIIHGNEGGL